MGSWERGDIFDIEKSSESQTLKCSTFFAQINSKERYSGEFYSSSLLFSGHTVILQLTKNFFGGLIHELAIVGKKAFALSAALGLRARHFDPGRIFRNGILPGSCRKTETAV